MKVDPRELGTKTKSLDPVVAMSWGGVGDVGLPPSVERLSGPPGTDGQTEASGLKSYDNCRRVLSDNVLLLLD
jgi:hypothetical protein